jgi:hypothetical protein
MISLKPFKVRHREWKKAAQEHFSKKVAVDIEYGFF